MEEKIETIFALIFIGIMGIVWFSGFGVARVLDEYKYNRDVVRVERDTEYVTLPPVHDTIIHLRTVPSGIVKATFAKAESRTPAEAITLEDTSVILAPDTTASPSPDSVDVMVPIERRTFTGENYEAIVEGWNPRLVDITISRPAMVVTQTTTKTTTKRWSVTIGPQGGYGITPAGWQPYIGIGFTFGYTF